MIKKSTAHLFLKAQLAALIGGMFDYAVMIFCTEYFKIYYAKSIIISGLLGAFVNFSINRRWTYQANHISFSKQLFKFYLVVLGSIFLKSAGTYFFTEGFRVDYKISRLIVDLFVSIGFNFVLQRYWVFRAEKVYQVD